uniref:Dopamine beta-hydroxylase n=1 Tax=Astyanax mexicanus TaxID=7994 RepID=A0A8B9GQH1_ASTMX
MRVLNKDLRLQDVVLMYVTLLAALVVLLVAPYQAPSAAAPPGPPLSYSVPLDPAGRLQLSWNLSFSRQEIHLQIRVKDLQHGLLIGLSDRGQPTNADLVLLWSDGHKSYFGWDATWDTKQDTEQDAEQDTEQDAEWTLSKTCEGTVHVIYALLDQPIRSLQQLNVSRLHTGVQRILLLRPDTPAPSLPADVQSIEVLAPGITIPSQETTYWCHIYQLPPNMPKNHIVMYESVVTPGNEAIVHHIEVFECSPQMDVVPQYSGSCDSKMKPANLNYCRHVLAAWALGAEPFYYPMDAGLPIGGEGSSRFLRLEVHYHNPLIISGRQDSSGIRLWYTRSLRRFDAGIMELGLVYTPVMAIPPRQSSFPLNGYCIPACTRTGDALVTKCTFNTEDRNKPTVGGFGIMEEMCVNYVHYYPRTQLELCKSHVDLDYLKKYFSLINSRFHGGEGCSCSQRSVEEEFSSISWDQFSEEVLNSLYTTSPISMHCNQSTAELFPVSTFTFQWEGTHQHTHIYIYI